jgi:hypothetical protein
VTRAAKKTTTPRWFALSALRRHGWGEQRIRDTLSRAGAGCWHGYPQREVSGADWGRDSTKIDCEADTATIYSVGAGPDEAIQWFERIEELKLLLPAGIDGAPLADIEALVSPAPEPGSDSPPRGGTERWVFNEMERDPPRKGDREYARRLWGRRADKSIELKTVRNYVGKHRKRLELPAEIPASSRKR